MFNFFVLLLIQSQIFQRWRIEVYALFLGVLLILFGVVLIYFKRRIAQQYQIKEAERVRDLVRSLRHDWMNHVQVIMGYQMLKQSQKIDHYLQKLTQIANEERKISDLAYPPLASTLLTLNYDYSQWNWKVQKNDTIDSLSVKQQRKLHRIFIQLLPWITKQIAHQTIWSDIDLTLSYEDRVLLIQFCFVNKQDKNADSSIPQMDWDPLPKSLDRQKVSYQWDDKEHHLLVQVPLHSNT